MASRVQKIKVHTEFIPPIRWDIKNQRGVHKTVRFEGLNFCIGDKRYTICGTEAFEDDCWHIITNVETGVTRRVSGKTIRMWMDKK